MTNKFSQIMGLKDLVEVVVTEFTDCSSNDKTLLLKISQPPRCLKAHSIYTNNRLFFNTITIKTLY